MRLISLMLPLLVLSGCASQVTVSAQQEPVKKSCKQLLEEEIVQLNAETAAYYAKKAAGGAP